VSADLPSVFVTHGALLVALLLYAVAWKRAHADHGRKELSGSTA